MTNAAPVECRSMAGPERFDVFALMKNFRADERRLGDALATFIEREDYGFVWLGYREDRAVACCSVGYAIGAAAGGIVALVRDLYVIPDVRRTGVATALLAALAQRLAALEIKQIEIAATGDTAFLAFLDARGFSVTAGMFAARR